MKTERLLIFAMAIVLLAMSYKIGATRGLLRLDASHTSCMECGAAGYFGKQFFL